MAGPSAAVRRDTVPAPRDLHAPITSLPLSSLDELPETLADVGEVTQVHFHFPVEIEVVRSAPLVDEEAIIEAALSRLAARVASLRG